MENCSRQTKIFPSGVKTVEDFLDSIEDQRLYQVLIKMDRLTIQTALWKMDGYSNSVQKKISPPLYGTNIGSYIKSEGGACYVKHREFVYVGEPVPELNEREHAAFLMNIQRAILLSLEKRDLLTASQRERCLIELEKQNSLDQRRQRQA